MSNPNIVNVSSILGVTAVLAVNTTTQTIVSNTASSNKVLKLETLIVSNTGTGSASVTVSVQRSSVDYNIATSIVIPQGSSLAVVDKPTTIYLLEGDALRITGSAAAMTAVCSYEEIS